MTRRRVGCLAVVLIAALALLAVGAWRGWSGAGPLEAPATVTIADGASLTAAAETLEDAGVIHSQDRFLMLARLFGGDEPVRAGEYEMPAHVSASQALRILQREVAVQRFVTIPEGMPSVLVRDRLMAEPLLTGEVPVPAEGSVLPDSYSYERGESRAAVLVRMQAAMRGELARLWPRRTRRSIVRTPAEAVTLASIVEKETAVPAERRTVAGVYTNRLREGMMLQADPTIIYPITRGRPLGRRIRRSEIRQRNGYNTYAMTGLPAGPIANPGRESIAAVLDPAPTDALYFVADGRGGHVFAATLEEHNRNVERWYAIRRARGEM
ncbi:MAG: endolytic transglycosylase MltG [Sphingomonadaceae bacterium]|nr:endolytic transglycosylase MltG [Sphingomonadaceae bacterium]